MSKSSLDCILVGYYHVDFHDTFALAKPAASRSGYLEYLKHNSVLVQGRRLTYMELLNHTVKLAGGTDPNFHVARLPNLASCYLYSFLNKRGLSVEIVNFMNHERERFKELLHCGPRAVAISTTLYLDPSPITEIVRFVRQWNRNAKIIVGGPFIANLCRMQDPITRDLTFKSMGADIYVNDSQGELTLCRVLGELGSSSANLAAIPNLFYQKGESFHQTVAQPENNDIDDSSIDWSLFDRSYLGATVQTRTARSCAFKCSFCSHPEMAGQLTLSSIDTIEAELTKMKAAQVKNVVFIDDTFNVPLPRFKALCRMMIRNGFGFRWYSYLRCSNMDDEAFDLVAESGCAGVFLGVESGDNNVLHEMDKFSSVEKLKQGIFKLNERNIVTFASFIVGFPGETDESVANTIGFIREARPRFYRAELWYADPLTPIVRRAAEFDLRGGGFSWRHRTMDWKQGSEWVRQIYSTVEESIILPVFDFDFWSIPYLSGQGVRMSQFEGFASTAAKLMIKSLDDISFDATPFEAELMQSIRS